jgi:hypothetical protein
MSRAKPIVLAVGLAILAGVVIYALSDRSPVTDFEADDVIIEDVGEGVQSAVLAFADRGANGIVTERRDVVVPEDRSGKARRILEELIRGPEGQAVATIPANTRVLSVVFDDAGGVYVDFSRELVSEHPGGSTGELFTIRSVVRTLHDNFPEVERVQFLVEGREIESIAGHYDAGEPFEVSQFGE